MRFVRKLFLKKIGLSHRFAAGKTDQAVDKVNRWSSMSAIAMLRMGNGCVF